MGQVPFDGLLVLFVGRNRCSAALGGTAGNVYISKTQTIDKTSSICRVRLHACSAADEQGSYNLALKHTYVARVQDRVSFWVLPLLLATHSLHIYIS